MLAALFVAIAQIPNPTQVGLDYVRVDIPIAGGPYDVATGDLDQDGDLDVVVSLEEGDAIAVLRNDGQGLQLDSTYSMGDGPHGVALHDIDGDGELDVATADERSDTVSLRMGLAGTAFGPRRTLATGHWPQDVLFADLVVDGIPDLLAVNSGWSSPGSLWVYPGTGTGAFGSPTITTHPELRSPIHAQLWDIDLDGNLDALPVDTSTIDQWVYVGNGSGGFSLGPLYPAWADYNRWLVLGDVGQDGWIDVFYWWIDGWGGKDLSLGCWEAVSKGWTLQSQKDIAYVSAFGGWDRAGDVADVNGDGKLDVVTTWKGYMLRAYLGDGAHNWPEYAVIGATGLQPIQVRVADLFGKFQPEILVTEKAGDALQVFTLPGFSVAPYGCGSHPPGSLWLSSGSPVPGGQPRFSIDNPLGTMASPGTAALLGVDLLPAPGYPCGISLPGMGMAVGAPAEVLLGLTTAQHWLPGSLWGGPGLPSKVALSIPPNAGLVGVKLYCQAVLIDVVTAGGAYIGLTEGLEITIGG